MKIGAALVMGFRPGPVYNTFGHYPSSLPEV
jgi:hypothetical protein